MRLPVNITGLSSSEPPLGPMDGQLFKKLGFEIARKVKGNVLQWIVPSYPLNYFRIVLEIEGKVVSILLHEYYPYVAIARYKDELQIEFFDYEEIESEIIPYFTVLKTDFLREPFNPNANDLAEIELKNVKHWRPRTNGEVIFNCWD